MNVDFEDPQLLKLAKFSLIFIKKESNGKNLKNSHRHTDTDLHYDHVKSRPCFVEAVNLFSNCSFTCLIFLVVFFCGTPCYVLVYGSILFYVLAETSKFILL